ncbi:hypothetical protein V1525DRAFT_400658 [Lipomyces kononenkoae]|uniref:Uncharacterized protein n=1 Tax=Lipomyces kononenkoae TaxID=34357 RepID=A0ACC3T4T3_LIPKO
MTSGDGREAEVSRYLDDDRFHRSFTLPPNTNRSTDFKVTYADFGHHNDEHVILFCGPLLGSRYLLTTQDKLAQQYGVRIISPDRPGFGGTTDVGPSDRIRVWLHIVEALLQHLSIRHVSLACYSGGSIYAMNVLLHLRHLLHSTHPYVAICAPWVHPSRSGVLSLRLASALPDKIVGNYDRLVNFFQSSLGPVLNFSSDLAVIVPSIHRGSDFLAPGTNIDAVTLEESLRPELVRRVMAEDIRGLGQDALLLLKRAEHPEYWGTWGDYDTLVPLLAQGENERYATVSSPVPPLKVDVFFAESDHMIGTAIGPTWFNHSWRPEQRGDRIHYSSVVVPKATHDNILDLRYGVLERIFQGLLG